MAAKIDQIRSLSSEDLGVFIAQRRKQLGLTQTDLAVLSGCGIASVVRLEAGRPTVRLDKLSDILRALGLRFRLEVGMGGIVVDAAI